MSSTYEKIATTTLGTAAADITFSTISGSYTDLVLVLGSLTTASSSQRIRMQLNSDTGTTYSNTDLYGDGSSTGSTRNTGNAYINTTMATTSTTVPSTVIMNFNNYSNATTFKTVLSRANTSDNYVSASVGLWRSTSAITNIKLFCGTGNISAGTTATLYGIKAE
jgi:hypothetical protein